jgi:PAS domain S-box-containing protein
LPNTSAWFFYLTFSSLVLLLVIVSVRPREAPEAPSRVYVVYVAVTLVSILVGVLFALFEGALPAIVVNGAYTLPSLISNYVLVVLFAIAAVLAYRRCRREQDSMLGYLALFLVLMAFALLYFALGGRRYDAWWYGGRSIIVISYILMLFGLLQEGYKLFGLERVRLAERQRLLERVQAQNEELQSAAEELQRQNEEIQQQSEEIQSQSQEIRQQSEALRQQNDLLEHAPVLVRDMDDRIILWNSGMEKLYGFSRAEAAGKVIHDLFGTQAQLPLPEIRARILADGRWEGALSRHRKDGSVVIVTSLQVLHTDAGDNPSAIVEVDTDITEQKRLEKLRDEFLSTAAHELKTPLTGLKGYSQLLLRRAAKEGGQQDTKALETINRQTGRLNKLVDELLEMSRLNLGQLVLSVESVDLGQFVTETVETLALIGDGHPVRCDLQASAVVQADRNRLEQVLTNLVSNAIRYSPDGGEVEVCVMRRDGQAVVSVKDQGIGIPKEKQGRIFEHFYRAHAGTRNDLGGMGIGLYISREIVTRHGGEMWFESEEGKGSTFYFSLPLV